MAKKLARRGSGNSLVVHQSISGPIPSPQILAGYEQILPGAAERVVAMAEKEQEHRHRMESRMAYRQSADAAGIALLRAEAERDEMERKLNRYLAAMTEWVETGDAAFEAARRALIRPEDELPPDVMRGVENRAIRAENAISAIVEEARRG